MNRQRARVDDQPDAGLPCLLYSMHYVAISVPGPDARHAVELWLCPLHVVTFMTTAAAVTAALEAQDAMVVVRDLPEADGDHRCEWKRGAKP